jgi:putative heme-binding domain-containing protein
MRFLLAGGVVCGLAVGALAGMVIHGLAAGQQQGTRVPWTTSKIHGSPEPPPPYRLERVFGKLGFAKLTHMAAAPGTRRLFVSTELGQIYSLLPDENVEKADPFLNLPRDVKSCQPGDGVRGFDALYSLVFHPRFQDNRFVYVAYVVDGTQGKPKPALKNRQRVSRFTVDKADPPRADPLSEQIILEWPTEKGGHNGCTLCFGPDGYLYISVGDGGPASPPDLYNTGQDLSDLLASILRIDVDKVSEGKRYRVPDDNPFVKMPEARPEIWAYGLRNPWKMSFDRATGDLWVGDVGWEMWEMVYRIRKGGNYGWSIVEGPQPVHPQAKQGPTPILPHELYFSHSEAASITGGYVYHGKRLPELVGSYICGDWMTCKVWSTRFEGERVVSHKEIAQGRMRIIAFGEDNDGELYILGYGDNDGIYRLVPNSATDSAAKFPRKLIATGLFASVAQHTPAPGVLPYTIQAAAWMDHAEAERLVALDNVSTVHFHDRAIPVPGTAFFNSRVFFPREAVLAKTISMEMERGNPGSKRRLETQILHYDGENWSGYTYRWNDEQTDAELVPAAGAAVELEIIDKESPGGRRKQTWRFASRGQCLICHNGWSGPPLSFTPEQLNRQGQLERFQADSIVARAVAAGKAKAKTPADDKVRTLFSMADPYDAAQPLATRARSYLAVNCSPCHQNGAGGTATIDLRAEINVGATKAVDVVPVQGTFGIAEARLLAPADPFRSVLYYRISKTGPGRMPHIGSEIVDARGVDVVHDWIRSLPGKNDADTHKSEKADLDAVLAWEGTDPGKNPALQRLLSSTPGALMLARAVEGKAVPEPRRAAIVDVAAAHPESTIRELFERFLPADKRVQRLGTVIQAQTLLKLKGDPEAGRKVFFTTAGVQCAVCHKVGNSGGAVGPDLSQIGKKLDRAKILESILDPSKEIDPAFVSYAVRIHDGRVVVGLIVSRNEKEIVVRDAQAKEHRFAATEVDAVTPQRQSLMPEQLLRDLTAQQAADLIEFLASLKGQ